MEGNLRLTGLLRWSEVTYRILEAEQHHLDLADGRAVKVQLQFELRQRAGDDLPVRHAHKVRQAHHQGRDVLMPQSGLLRALGGQYGPTDRKGDSWVDGSDGWWKGR